MPTPEPPQPGTHLRTLSIVEQTLATVTPRARIALAQRALQRALEVAQTTAPIDPTTRNALAGVLARATAHRLGQPIATLNPPRLTARTAAGPTEAALTGAALALLQAMDAPANAHASLTTGARRCIERTLPLLIPRLIDAWTALRNDARRCSTLTPDAPVTDEHLGPLW